MALAAHGHCWGITTTKNSIPTDTQNRLEDTHARACRPSREISGHEGHQDSPDHSEDHVRGGQGAEKSGCNC